MIDSSIPFFRLGFFPPEKAMNPVRRTTITESTATSLAREIARGRWNGFLPSTRCLAEMLQVSRPSLMAALGDLEARGVIFREGPRRPYCVSSSANLGKPEVEVSPQERRVVFIFSSDTVQYDAFNLLVSLMMRPSGRSWRCLMTRIPFARNEYRPRQWQRSLEPLKPDRIIVWCGCQRFAGWLAASGTPALFLGGETGDTGLARVRIRSELAVTAGLSEVFCRGHQRVWLPLCERTEEYTLRLVNAVRKTFESHGVRFSQAVHMPISRYRGPDVIASMFAKALSVNPPTAMILHDWREFLALSALFRSRGLDIPRDISVAIIGHDPEMHWHQPRLAHMETPVKRFANACLKWLETDPAQRASREIEIKAKWDWGESLAEPPGE